MQLRLAPQAEADLDEIWWYVAEDSGSIDTATREVDRIRDALGSLLKFPFLGRRRDSELRAGSRSLVIDKYIALYRIRPGEIQIMRIAHGNRDLDALFSEE